MELSFDKHGPNCTPSSPCLMCKIKVSVEKRAPMLYQDPFEKLKAAIGRSTFSLQTHEPNCRPCDPCSNCNAWAHIVQFTGISNRDHLRNSLGLKEPKVSPPVEATQDTLRAIRLDTLELSARILNQFGYDNIHTVGDVLKRSRAELLRVPNIGRKSLKELEAVLMTMDLHIGMDAS